MAPVDRFQETVRPRAPGGPWATLLRVAWLAIVLGLLLQLALLLVAAGFAKGSSPRPVLAEAVNAAGVPAGPAPLWVLAIRAAEYGCLGLALEGSVGAPGGAPWGTWRSGC